MTRSPIELSWTAKQNTHLSIHTKISVFCCGILLKELQICANQLLPFRRVGLLCGVEKLPPILSVDDLITQPPTRKRGMHLFLILCNIWSGGRDNHYIYKKLLRQSWHFSSKIETAIIAGQCCQVWYGTTIQGILERRSYLNPNLLGALTKVCIFCNKNVFFLDQLFFLRQFDRNNNNPFCGWWNLICWLGEWMRKKHGQFLFCNKKCFFCA